MARWVHIAGGKAHVAIEFAQRSGWDSGEMSGGLSGMYRLPERWLSFLRFLALKHARLFRDPGQR